LLSEALYEEYYNRYEGGALFVDLSSYVQDSAAEPEYVGDGNRGIKLSSLPFKNLPEISSLPEDTVLCLRTLSQGPFNSGGNTEQFERAQQVIRNILSFK
jgi:hypothetical protein